jgi:hypothetical protein
LVSVWLGLSAVAVGTLHGLDQGAEHFDVIGGGIDRDPEHLGRLGRIPPHDPPELGDPVVEAVLLPVSGW